MQIPVNKVICDPDQCFYCENCDDACCNSFSIIINETTKNNLSRLETVKNTIKETGYTFEELASNAFYLPVYPNNRNLQCIFYNKQEKCLIHSREGYSHKPPECQMFPFGLYFDRHNNIHIECSFFCTGILSNNGRLLEEIKHLIPSYYINYEFYPESFELKNGSLSQDDFFKLAGYLSKVISDTTISLDDAVMKYFLTLKNFLSSYNDSSDIDKILEKIYILPEMNTQKAHYQMIVDLIKSLYISKLLLFSRFNRQNSLFKKPLKIITLYFKIFSGFLLKKNSLPENLTGYHIDFNKANQVLFDLDAESDILIRRFLRSNIIRYKYIKPDSYNLCFLNSVIIYYSLIKDSSKLIAASGNRFSTSYNDVKKAVSQIEFVYYHSRTPFFPVKTLEPVLKTFISKMLQNETIVFKLIR
jgi:Fe-S-cluster containining protein